MQKLILALFAVVGLYSNANAISLVFKFDVESSGPSIYACNAGIMHQDYRKHICYDRVTNKDCNPDLCEEGKTCNCVCTGDILNEDFAGEYKYDFLTAKTAKWQDNQEKAGKTTKRSVRAYTDRYRKIFDTEDAFKHQLTHLDFNLSSERYGAEYFVDICFRGSDIDFYGKAKQGYEFTNLQYLIDSQVTVTDLGKKGAPKYQRVADLASSAEVICDVQGYGRHKGDADGKITFEKDMKHKLHKNKSMKTTDVVSGNSKTLKGPRNAPRFCRVRYTFKEKSKDMRKWRKQKARICTTTVVNENADEIL